LREEMERPGFPSRLKGPWSKLEAYLARLSLILALVRNAQEEEGSFMAAIELVVEQDVKNAAELVRYFKAHARRVYSKLHGEKPEYLLAEALKVFLAKQGGSWEGQTSELYEILRARSVPGLPSGGPVWLGKRLREIAQQDPGLSLEDGWRGSDKIIRLVLITPGTPGGGGSTERLAGGTGGKTAHQDDHPGGGSDERAAGEEPSEPTSGPEDRRDEADEWGDSVSQNRRRRP